jgi:2-oxo-4-hydroxy-4-carboxy-5-ureidoimidazoline decarboxylase
MTLHELNTMPRPKLREDLLKCCGSVSWAEKMLPFFPADDLVELLEDAEEQWYLCKEEDWKEAFGAHPKIGDIGSLQKKFAATSNWVSREQSGVESASNETIRSLAAANEQYERKFGYIFIISATGKSAEEMLANLEQRLQNNPEVELTVAADEQNKITRLRLEKLVE